MSKLLTQEKSRDEANMKSSDDRVLVCPTPDETIVGNVTKVNMPPMDVTEAYSSSTHLAIPPNRVKSLLRGFQRLPTPESTPTPDQRVSAQNQNVPQRSGKNSLSSVSSPFGIYTLRPLIPSHLNDKMVANPVIQLELEHLKAKSVAAKRREGVLERAKMFGGHVGR